MAHPLHPYQYSLALVIPRFVLCNQSTTYRHSCFFYPPLNLPNMAMAISISISTPPTYKLISLTARFLPPSLVSNSLRILINLAN